MGTRAIFEVPSNEFPQGRVWIEDEYGFLWEVPKDLAALRKAVEFWLEQNPEDELPAEPSSPSESEDEVSNSFPLKEV
jgi:hypothetical protein